jgi:hypothetical protein
MSSEFTISKNSRLEKYRGTIERSLSVFIISLYLCALMCLVTLLLKRSKKSYNLVRIYYNSMKSSICAKIPTELYEEVQDAIRTEKYTSNTKCIMEGLLYYCVIRNKRTQSLRFYYKRRKKKYKTSKMK